MNVESKPRVALHHWDNLDASSAAAQGSRCGSVVAPPDSPAPRYRDYARANASLGINGAALTNVNANAQVLTQPFLQRSRRSRMSTVSCLSHRALLSADRDRRTARGPVAAWWKTKTAEIYRLIPDFGGFLVKANRRASPGRRALARRRCQHAGGRRGSVRWHGEKKWRAFVYSNDVPVDSIKQAYDEFKPLDVARECPNPGEERAARLPAARARRCRRQPWSSCRSPRDANTHTSVPTSRKCCNTDTGTGSTVARVVLHGRERGGRSPASRTLARTATGPARTLRRTGTRSDASRGTGPFGWKHRRGVDPPDSHERCGERWAHWSHDARVAMRSQT